MAEQIPLTPPLFQTSLAFPITPTDTSLEVADGNIFGGGSLTARLVALSVDIGTPTPEYILGIMTGNTVTNLVRGIDALNPTLSVPANAFDHERGAVVKITDFTAICLMRNILNGDTGLENILFYLTHPTFTLDEQIIDKKYADDAIAAAIIIIQNYINSIIGQLGSSGGGGTKSKSWDYSTILSSPTQFIQNQYQNVEVYITKNTTTLRIEMPGQLYKTRNVTLDWAQATDIVSTVTLGRATYALLKNATTNPDEYRLYKYDNSDLTIAGVQITFSGAVVLTNTNNALIMTSDGVDFYFNFEAGASANDYALARFALTANNLAYVSTTNCGAVAGRFARFAVFSGGLNYGYAAGVLYVFSTLGVLQDTITGYDAAFTALTNWSNAIYLAGTADLNYIRIDTDEESIIASPFELIATAEEDLTPGMPAGISNVIDSRVARAVRSNNVSALDYTAQQDSKCNLFTCIADDKVASVLQDNGTLTDLRTFISIVDRSTMSVANGASVLLTNDFYSANGELSCLCKLDTDKYVAFYVTNANKDQVQAVVATVVGDVITLGTPQTVFTTAGQLLTEISSCQMGVDQGVFYGITDNTGADSRIFGFTVAGTVITVGAAATLGTNISGSISTCGRVTKIDIATFVVCNNFSYTQVGTISGDTVTMGVEQLFPDFSASNSEEFDLIAYDVLKYAIRFRGTGAQAEIILASVVGTVSTFGAGFSLVSHGDGSLYVKSPTEIYDIQFQGTANNGIFLLSVSGITVNSSTRAMQAGLVTVSRIATMDNGYFVAMRSTNASTMNTFIFGMSNDFFGIVQNTVARGGSARVLYEGIDTHQLGLFAGAYYQAVNGALVFTPTGATTDNPNETKLLLAISATSIKLP